ncbi:MAG TPA: RNA polymerase-binding protein DksA [Candidatus Desulfofervidus auxilii]|uniref:RNA polymerase-binding transcription factor DksA n=1 Tax=Desulfofervidus auxilii TaxID=1621989 RepID=A0A7C0Y9L0_DESA2|nr:RNA polymerase-binding protein DksA [Candidatus Desulfofervidus auxilii]HDD43932.1 RNA polymerase-binding protein DksA [Candidatus Desulfofervidus auxilii]
MDKEKLEFFKQLLLKQREELLQHARQTMDSLSAEGEEVPADLADRASLETERNFLLRIRDRERKLIAKIDEALKKIENGTYGICELCGREIEEERLKARPVASYCIECKRKLEAMEKLQRR